MDADGQSAAALSAVGLPAALAAMAMTTALIALLFPLLRRYALARPNARSSHQAPTPQGGGIAVIAGALTAWLGALAGTSGLSLLADQHLAALVLATLALAALGLVDDIRPLAPAPRLALQAIAIGLVVATLPADLRILPALPVLAERAALALALVWFVNLVNFMDGIDWMSVAEIAPVTAALAILAALGALPPAAGLAACAVCGAMLGFAPFNKPVARLFLGDVGSLPIGLLTGWMLALLAASGHLAAALLLTLYYVTDATVTLLRRLAARERVWEAHRTHFYQRALANGRTVRQVVGWVFAVNIALAALAVMTVLTPGLPSALAALGAGGTLVAATLARWSRPRRAAAPSADAS